MRLYAALSLLLAATSSPCVSAYSKGAGKKWQGIDFRKFEKRQADAADSDLLLGDLLTVPTSEWTQTAWDVAGILLGNLEPTSAETYNPPRFDSLDCAWDRCCPWWYAAKDMHRLFHGASGRCTKYARFAVRLGFHDAGTWSKFTGTKGGADGSILLSPDELSRTENSGLSEIAVKMRAFYEQYRDYGLSMADIIQVGASVAAVTCPLGPRGRTFVGRLDSNASAPHGLLPPEDGSAEFLVDLFRNKTISPHGLAALIGAHTTSQQRFVDPKRALDPQDSTPGVWDVLFYKQVLGLAPVPKRIFFFRSDKNLAAMGETMNEMGQFAGDGGQDHWNTVWALPSSALIPSC